jgi:hypothetical protein
MVRALGSFLDFCYLVRQSTINETALDAIDNALARFHQDCVIFEATGVQPTGFSLPRQHSAIHYRRLIELFGAPNGICSSITESKHIKAVKQPWCRSSHFNTLGQMLLTNQHIDKLSACHVDFAERGMLQGPCLAPTVEIQTVHIAVNEDPDDEVVEGPRVLATVELAKRHSMILLLLSVLYLI